MPNEKSLLRNGWLSGPVTPSFCSTGNDPDFLNTQTNQLFACINDSYQLVGTVGVFTQTPWQSNIDGGGFVLSNVGGINVNGNINVGGQVLINGVPLAANQTPWLSNINGAGFNLSNVANITTGQEIINQPAGVISPLTLQSTGSNRWVVMRNAAPETGGNAGSNFEIDAYADNGTLLSVPFTIIRNSGLVQLGSGLTVTGDVNITGNYLSNGTPIANALQSPWLENINGAGFNLSNVGQISANTVQSTGAFNNSPTGQNRVQSGVIGSVPEIVLENSGATLWNMNNTAGVIGWTTPAAAGNMMQLGTPGGNSQLQLLLGNGTVANQISSSGNSYFNGGNIGIGTLFPAFPLDVVGDLNITGTYRVNGIPINLGGSVTSVFGRQGVVVPQIGDYTAAMVTNAVDSSVVYNNPPWLGSLSWSKITGAPNFIIDPTTTTGDLIVRGPTGLTRLGVGPDGNVIIADSTQPNGIRWGSIGSIGGGGGTPAGSTGQIQFNNAGAFGASPNLTWNTTTNSLLAVGNDGTVLPDANTTDTHVIIGPTVATANYGELTVAGNTTSNNATYGSVNFANYARTVVEKRMGIISGTLNGSGSSYSALRFQAMSNGNLDPIGIYMTGGNAGTSLTLGSISGGQAFNIFRSGASPAGINLTTDSGNSSTSTLIGTSYIGSGGISSAGLIISGQVIRGSSATPTIIQPGDIELQLQGFGWDGGNIQRSAIIQMVADGTWVINANRPTAITFSTASAIAVTERMRITSAGLVGIGVTTPGAGLQVNNVVFVTGENNFATTGSGVEIYSSATTGHIDAWDYGPNALMPLMINGAPLYLNGGPVAANAGSAIQLDQFFGIATTVASASNFRIYIAAGSKFVGIGENFKTAAYALDVIGDINITGVYRVNGIPIGTGGGATPGGVNGSVQFNNAGAFGGSTNLVWDNTNNRLGIGIAAPLAPLHVFGSSVDPEIVESTSTYSLIQFKISGVSHGYVGYSPNGSGGMSFLNAAGGTVNLLVTDTGNVGIATVSPAKALDVNGVITLQDGGIRTLPAGLTTELNSQILDIGINDDSTGRFGTYNSASQGGFLRFETRGDPAFSFFVRPAGSTATASSVFNITTTGNVGIGVSTPASKFVVMSGRSSFFANSEPYALYVAYNNATNGMFIGADASSNTVFSAANGTELVWISSSGFVGIGTSPVLPLTILAPGQDPSLTTTNGMIEMYASSGVALSAGIASSANVAWLQGKFITPGDGRSFNISLQPLGANVGIGILNPARILHVVGSTSASPTNQITIQGYQGAFEVLNGANSQNYYFGIDDADSNKLKIGIGASPRQALVPTITMTPGQPGNVGIGTTNPGAGLHVIGNNGIWGTAAFIGSTNRGVSIGDFGTAGAMLQGASSPTSGAGVTLILNPNGPGVATGAQLQVGAGFAATAGDLGVGRNATPTTGVVYFGNTGSTYIYWDATRFNITNQISVSGDCNITGTYRVNGTPLAPGLTGMSVVTTSRSIGTVFHNTITRPLFVVVALNMNANSENTAVSDANSSPGTVVAGATTGSSAGVFSLSFWAMPGNFYGVNQNAGAASIGFWIEYS